MYCNCLYTQVTKEVNNRTVKIPYQCFINGKFEDAENGKTYDTINPTDGSVSDVMHKQRLRKNSSVQILSMFEHCISHSGYM